MTYSFDGRATLPTDVMHRTVGDQSVILDLKTERYLGLDPIGTHMWSTILEAPSLESAYQKLLSEYDIEPSRLREELQTFLGKLVSNGLIHISDLSGRN